MLILDTTFRIDDALAKSPNLADRFSQDDLARIGAWVFDGYTQDCQSRSDWEKRMQAGMNLAMQITKTKTTPWPNCSNVAFPLVTIATLQFHSRAYPALVQPPDLVRYRVIGKDEKGALSARAERIGKHMSYQLLEEDEAWEEQHDRLLINIPIVGCAFKKTYYDGEKGHNVSELVLAQDLVMNYYAKSVEDCGRKTHIIPLYRNALHSAIVRGTFQDVREEAWYNQTATPQVSAQTTNSADQRQGTTAPQGDESTPFTTLEQHCFMDLDKDGYSEPYIVTIEATSKRVLRIVARFNSTKDIKRNSSREIICIECEEYFTKYTFIPSPDGGIYDIGFGILLGPLNEAVNSLVNQLIDAGTLANTAGGFLGRGAKVRGGNYSFSPFEWKRVDATGDDLRKSVFPLPVREPSGVLFQLLSLLIEFASRIPGNTETLVGALPGQNTPASTTQTAVEEGMKVYGAIFKRVWRSMKNEFRKMYVLNAAFMPSSKYYGEENRSIMKEDYLGDSGQVCPVADPNVTSDTARVNQAMTLKQVAASTPGYNTVEVERNFLRALKVENIDLIYPGPDPTPPPPDPELVLESKKLELKAQELQMEHQQFALELMEQRRLNTAEIMKLEAQAMKLIAEAKGEEMGQQLSALQTAIGAMKTQDDSMRARIETLLKGVEINERAKQSSSDGRGMARLAGPSSDQGIPGMLPPTEGIPEGAMG